MAYSNHYHSFGRTGAQHSVLGSRNTQVLALAMTVMGLGGTAKKLQKVMDAAEQLYSKMNEVVTELKQVQSEVEHTSERVDQIERDLARQRALLEALADQQGLDVENVLSEAELSDDSDSAGEQPDETEESTAIYATDEE